MTQMLLFPDARPLVDRLGWEFFRGLPEGPGIYLMRDAADLVLYVGKAKNLRRRLGSYRVANSERLPRRHLRLLRAVARIEIQESADERAALAREAELLRTLRPRFNRAGTWPAPPKFLALRLTSEGLQLAVTATPESDCRWHGPLGAGAKYLRAALVRLLWFALHPARGVSQLPVGWFRGKFGDTATIRFSAAAQICRLEVSTQLEGLFGGQPSRFGEWVLGKRTPAMPLFERAALEADIEYVTESFGGETESLQSSKLKVQSSKQAPCFKFQEPGKSEEFSNL